ncbi:helix-turn-helix transcriptional regulator [Streptosporangium sp. NPDC051022]|uniref:helix-turn-helix domain-containing protein n=1 Tax=Streptosporangium sp. NPDC051022 TaxID=3155752 RepID=UPI0034142ACD
MIDPHTAELLGIDPDAPETRRELRAVERDVRLIRSLVRLRRARGLTQAQVAERMSRSQPAISDFERLGGDPHLSTIRRYALAIGADVTHFVCAPGDPEGVSPVDPGAATRASAVACVRLDDGGHLRATGGGVTGGIVNVDLVRTAG